MTADKMHSAGNGNGRSRLAMRMSHLVDSHSFRETVGFTIAEFASMTMSLGVVGIADQIAPGSLRSASKVLSKVVIEPYLDSIESLMSRFCKLEECKVDNSQSREVRAEKLAHTLIVFSTAWSLSMVAKFAARRGMNHVLRVKDKPIIPTGNWLKDKVLFKVLHPDEWRLGLVDEGIHYGSLILLNTKAAPYTDELIKANTNILKKMGVPEKKAHELSSMAMIWELPNFLGLLAGIGVISHKHGHDWGQHKI